uniref:Uncharacterized protein n=1 Tax=Timema bartmani TaxID=61472 RepID=A0A7R9EZH5_9NEOP|nr:unnamed protein product [Timema bartmani]
MHKAAPFYHVRYSTLVDGIRVSQTTCGARRRSESVGGLSNTRQSPVFLPWEEPCPGLEMFLSAHSRDQLDTQHLTRSPRKSPKFWKREDEWRRMWRQQEENVETTGGECGDDRRRMWRRQEENVETTGGECGYNIYTHVHCYELYWRNSCSTNYLTN